MSDLPPCRVLLVDDHAIVREGLRASLSHYPDIEVVGEAADGKQGVEMAEVLRPDIVLMDISMPIMTGVEATRLLVERKLGCAVIVLSMHKHPEYVRKVVEAGAQGFMLKSAASAEIVACIRSVRAGKPAFSADVSDWLLPGIVHGDVKLAHGPATALSPRETQVLALIANSSSSKEIADRLGLSVRTVETHRERLMKKLGLRDVAALTRYALATGIVTEL